MKRFLFALAITGALPLNAHAAYRWSDSFAPAPLETYLDGADGGAIVLAAGPQTPELFRAATALEAAVKQSPKVKLVMNGAGLGAIDSLDDAAIVKRCVSLPVTRAMVVRVFSSGADKPAMAVVTIYNRRAEVLSAFSAQLGQAITPRESSKAAPTAELGSDTADAVSNVLRGSEEKQKDYDEKFVGFQEGVTVDARTGAVVNQWLTPYQGKYKRPLEMVDFYDVVGRHDLALQYREHAAKRGKALARGGVVLGIGAIAMTGGSVVWLMAEGKQTVNTPPDRAQENLGLGLMAGGLGLMAISPCMMAPAVTNPNPVTPAEARRLADEYNQRLRAGVSKPVTAADPPDPRVRIGIAATPTMGMAAVTVTF